MKPAVASLIATIPLAACAGGPTLSTTSISEAGSAYTLTAEELEYSCKQLTGRMEIRILSIRDYDAANNTSLTARTLQSGSTSALGGSKAGSDPIGDHARDRAMLEAYNRQLAAKNCKTFDLEAELQPKDFRATPTATIKPVAQHTN